MLTDTLSFGYFPKRFSNNSLVSFAKSVISGTLSSGLGLLPSLSRKSLVALSKSAIDWLTLNVETLI